MKHGDAITHVLPVGQQVRAHDHRLAAGLEVDDEILHLPGADRIESARRLVEHDEFGIVDERLGDADPSRHALRVLPQLPLAIAREPHHLDEHRGPSPPFVRGHVEEPAVEVERLLGVEELVEVALLGQVADALVLPHVGGLAPEDERLARRGENEPQQQLERRRLARAVRAEEAENFAAADFEVERLEGHLLASTPEIPVGLREVAGLDDDVTTTVTVSAS